jgi:urease subunit alpha
VGRAGRAKNALSATFVSRLALDNDLARKLDVQKPMLPIRSVRALRKQDMVRNDALPRIDVDAQTHDVYVDGGKVDLQPVTRVPLCRKFLLR